MKEKRYVTKGLAFIELPAGRYTLKQLRSFIEAIKRMNAVHCAANKKSMEIVK